MNGQDLWRGMNDIDEKYIQEAETAKFSTGRLWKGAGVLAACLCLTVLLAALLPNKPEPMQQNLPGGLTAGGALGTTETQETNPAQFQKPEVCDNRSEVLHDYAFTAQSIRTDGGREDTVYPIIKVVRSPQELKDYCSAQEAVFDLEAGFLGACEAYDEAYFAQKDLVLICLEETSGSISHRVTQVRKTADGWCITVARQAPAEGTCDMAQWHILVEIQRGKSIGPEDKVHLHLTKEDS